MSHNNVFHKVNLTISQVNRDVPARRESTVPFKMIVDEQGTVLTFTTRNEYQEFLYSRDRVKY